MNKPNDPKDVSKDRIPKYLTSGVVYKFQCSLFNESYYGECEKLERKNRWYISTDQLLMRDQLALPFLTNKILTTEMFKDIRK